MDFNEYQEKASSTALYPGEKTILGVSYCALGLAGEAGEYANKVKKVIRGDASLSEATELLVEELGDVLWYLSESAKNLGYSLEDIAALNIGKLAGRRERGTVRGSGDVR